MLDTLRSVQTPEGLALRLRCAGPIPRAIAWVVDLGIRLTLLLIASVLFAFSGPKASAGLVAIAAFCILWGYPIAYELLGGGQTPGKRLMGLRVVNANGTSVGWLPSIVRNLMRTVDMFPFAYGFGFASCMVDAWSRRLGDHAAGTLVVYVDKPGRRSWAAGAAPWAPALALGRDEQRAVLAFAERADTMTPARQDELAGLLAPVTGAAPARAREAALGLAAYLQGHR
jgi:uncharacterized RDD family membrane protein YckC